MQKAVNNFFSNLDDVLVIVNDVLQLKPLQTASDTGRLIINSSIGLFGLIDWASDMGLEKHNGSVIENSDKYRTPERCNIPLRRNLL